MINQIQHNTGVADESLWNEYCDHIDELMATGKYGGRYDAGLAVRKMYPHLANVQAPGVPSSGRVSSGAGVKSSRPASSGAATGESAEQQLDRLAKKIASERGISYAAGYVAVLNENPRLYVLYLQEHLARLTAKEGQRGQQSA